MSKKSILKEPEMIMAISAVFISMVAVAIALFEASIVREQQKSSVWPHIEVLTTNVDGFVYHATNKGLGPATIEDVRVTLNKKPILEWNELLRLLDSKFSWNKKQSTINRRVISPEETIEFLQLDKDSYMRIISLNQDFQLSVEICYCSVYKDCWKTTGLISKPVDSCETNREYSFNH